MSRVNFKDATNDQSLPEYVVGRANQSCIYPGIRQCFAIAGRRQTFMVCTHVSPGCTEEEYADHFALLAEFGGQEVTSWHVIGPFTDHFRYSKTWNSAQDIRDSFTAAFGDTGANHYILDVSKQRHTEVMETLPGVDGKPFRNKTSFGKIDVKAELDPGANKIRFYYRGDRVDTDWHRLYNKKFSRF